MAGVYEGLVPEGLDPVPVHVYTHPDWDMNLILLARPESRGEALDLLGDAYNCRGGSECLRVEHESPGPHNDPAELTVDEQLMPREEFVNLTEFDG